jgi:hypothetical protein
MPKPKPLSAETLLSEFNHQADKAGLTPVIEADQLFDLLHFVARAIKVRNANGKWMTTKCLLCAPSRLNKESCRHEQLFKLVE